MIYGHSITFSSLTKCGFTYVDTLMSRITVHGVWQCHMFMTSRHCIHWRVWSALSCAKTILPFYFNKPVDRAEYQGIIMDFIMNLPVEESYCYLQQDGAWVHTSAEKMSFLQEVFDDRFIRPPPPHWSQHSLDCTVGLFKKSSFCKRIGNNWGTETTHYTWNKHFPHAVSIVSSEIAQAAPFVQEGHIQYLLIVSIKIHFHTAMFIFYFWVSWLLAFRTFFFKICTFSKISPDSFFKIYILFYIRTYSSKYRYSLF